jgi:hypothetical protein
MDQKLKDNSQQVKPKFEKSRLIKALMVIEEFNKKREILIKHLYGNNQK